MCLKWSSVHVTSHFYARMDSFNGRKKIDEENERNLYALVKRRAAWVYWGSR